jgi:hypothetical protein
MVISIGVRGGAGGAGVNGGGDSGTVTVPADLRGGLASVYNPIYQLFGGGTPGGTANFNSVIRSSSGGGGGGGSGSIAVGRGGGGGGGAGILYLMAPHITISATGIVQCLGGNGAAGTGTGAIGPPATPGGGGGGGGGHGIVFLYCDTYTIPSPITSYVQVTSASNFGLGAVGSFGAVADPGIAGSAGYYVLTGVPYVAAGADDGLGRRWTGYLQTGLLNDCGPGYFYTRRSAHDDKAIDLMAVGYTANPQLLLWIY